MNRTNPLAIAALLLLGATPFAGCTDDDEALTEAQFVEQANAICVDADAKIGEALGPIFEGEPTPDELQAALDAIVSTSRETSASLAALTPPATMTQDVAEMLSAFNAANDEAEDQGSAFFETDGDPWAPVGVIAARLGLDRCANG